MYKVIKKQMKPIGTWSFKVHRVKSKFTTTAQYLNKKGKLHHKTIVVLLRYVIDPYFSSTVHSRRWCIIIQRARPRSFQTPFKTEIECEKNISMKIYPRFFSKIKDLSCFQLSFRFAKILSMYRVF